MKEILRPVAVLAVLTLLAPLLGATASGTSRAPAASDYVQSLSAERYFEVGQPLTMEGSGVAQSLPEIFFDSQGGMVLAYLDGTWLYYGTPHFARFNGTTGQPVGSPIQVAGTAQWDPWGNATARGAYTALDSQDHVVRAYFTYGFPNDVVYYTERDLVGNIVRGATRVGNTSYWSPSAAVAVGKNDSVHILRDEARLLYSRFEANGTPTRRDVVLYNDLATIFPPQITYNKPAGTYLVSWVSNDGTGRLLALDENASVAWGPLSLGRTGANLSVGLLSDGAFAAVWSVSNAIRAVKFASNGSVLLSDRAVLSGLNYAQTPRPVLSPSGELVIIWSDLTEPSDLEVRAAALNLTDFTVTIPATKITDDARPSVNARAVFGPDGTMWVVFQNDTSTGQASILAIPVRVRWSGFELRTPQQNATAYRGEPFEAPLRIASAVGEDTNYTVSARVENVRGPAGWTAEVVDAAAGAAVSEFGLGPLGRANLTLKVGAPVADPAGYGAYVSVTVRDAHRPQAILIAVLNLTVAQGHRYAFTPLEQNLTVLPGGQASVQVVLRDDGVLAEVAVPLTLSVPPPPGWEAALNPAAFSAAPGESRAFTLSVTAPPNASSTDAYCGRIWVQHPNDTFARASSGFCVRAALVAVPKVTPGEAEVTLEPGTPLGTSWTLENSGNAAYPIECRVVVVETLPSGWSVIGSPARLLLAANARGNVSVSFAAPVDAIGGTRLPLTLRATCEGSNATGEARLVLVAREIHALSWRAQGSTVDANESGAAVVVLTAENAGNVAETVNVTVLEAPGGWSVNAVLSVGGVAAEQVPPFSTGLMTLTVEAPGRSLAGSYRVTISLAAGDWPAAAMTFTVRIPKIYGLELSVAPAAPSVGPGETFSIAGRLTHASNTIVSYTLRVEVRAQQVWTWTAQYLPDLEGDVSYYFGGTLSLDAFSAGAFILNLTAPREPYAASVVVTVSLSSSSGAGASHTSEIAIGLADLDVTLGPAPSGVADPRLLTTVLVRVANRGTHAAEAVEVRLLLDGAVVWSVTVPSLGPGEIFTQEVALDLSGGSHLLVAVVDPLDAAGASPLYGLVFELDEANNEARASFTVGAPSTPPPPVPREEVPTGAGGAGPLLAALAFAAAGAFAAGVLLLMRRHKRA